MTVVWPSEPGLGSLSCSWEEPWERHDAGLSGVCGGVNYPPGQAITIECRLEWDEPEWVWGYKCVCPANSECDVTCDQCKGVECPTDAPCEVTCIGDVICPEDFRLPCDVHLYAIDCPEDFICDVTCENAACRDIHVRWPTTPGLGRLQCVGHTACSYIEFPEPEPTTPLHIDCNDWQCFWSEIHCPAHADCSLTCSNSSCRYASLTCPSDATCSVVCVDEESCLNLAVEWPSEPGLGSLSCPASLDGLCNRVNFPPGHEVVIVCDEDNECFDTPIHCPDWNECSVICSGAMSCHVIECPTNAPCSVTCSGIDSCAHGGNITCPEDFQCDISCGGEGSRGSCTGLSIEWPSTPGLGSLECQGFADCSRLDFPEPEPTVPLHIDCTADDYICMESTIRCPAHAICSLTCANGGCEGASLICPSNATCSVDCLDESGCENMTVVWPSEPGLGSLSCSWEEPWERHDAGLSGVCGGVNYPPGQAITIECRLEWDEPEWVWGYKCVCPANSECDVTCDQCKGVECPTDAPCEVTCIGDVICPEDFRLPCDVHLYAIDCPEDFICDVTCENAACRDIHVRWPTTPGLGRLQCVGHTACSYIEFPEPEPTTPLHIDCNDWQCFWSEIHCPAHADCSLTCSNSSCRYASLTCPSDATCSVVCVDEESCLNLVVEWPSEPGLGSLSCPESSDGLCNRVNLPPGQEVSIVCDEDNECINEVINCNPVGGCSVTCMDSACNDLTINCPADDYECSVVCVNESSCTNVSVQWPSEPGLGSLSCLWEEPSNNCAQIGLSEGVNHPPGQELVIICNGLDCKGDIQCAADSPCSVICSGNCRSASIQCPANYPCHVSCGASSCVGLQVQWPSTPGLGSLDCSGYESCRYVDFPEPEPTEPLHMNCTDWACADATILCPSEASCWLTCADVGCLMTKLICPSDRACSLHCDGPNSCAWMSVEWPSDSDLRRCYGDGCAYVNQIPMDDTAPPVLTTDSREVQGERVDFVEVNSNAIATARSASLLNEPLWLMVGAFGVAMALVMAFYVCVGRAKEVEASWDDE